MSKKDLGLFDGGNGEKNDQSADPFPKWNASRDTAAKNAAGIGREIDSSLISSEYKTRQLPRMIASLLRKRRIMNALGPIITTYIVKPRYNLPFIDKSSSANKGGLSSHDLDEETIEALFRTPGVARFMHQH